MENESVMQRVIRFVESSNELEADELDELLPGVSHRGITQALHNAVYGRYLTIVRRSKRINAYTGHLPGARYGLGSKARGTPKRANPKPLAPVREAPRRVSSVFDLGAALNA
jgi:hypothetical protein